MRGIFANRWWVVFASACGLMVGTGSIMIFSFGVFLKPVTEGLGVSRGLLSSALGFSTWPTAAACVLVGWLVDRYGARRVMIPGLMLFAAAVAGYGLMQPQPVILIFLIFGLVGFFGAVQMPIPYAAVISHWFDRERGLALGIATAGVGLGTALVPQLAAFLIARFGWREAYFGLAAAVLVLALLPVTLFLREPAGARAGAAARAAGGAASVLPGVDARAALRAWRFWALTVAFFLGVLAINGTIVHVVALLTDRGIPAERAVGALSAAGLAIIGGRIFCGWCLDRFFGPYVAICFFAVPMVGIALLGSGYRGPVPVLGAALCGAGIGAEIDLMAFFVSRYFGLKAYGKIYGLMFMLFNVGTGLGPALSGRSFDMFHSYGPIFVVYEIALAITCMLFLPLGPYAYPARKPALAAPAGEAGEPLVS